MFGPKWDKRFLNLAQEVSTFSRDPSTQVGAVIVRPDKTIASIGYNGFARGVLDNAGRYNDRDTKYEMIVHGEMNAILAAREPLHGYTLYTYPFPPCSRCAAMIIQSGIANVVAPSPTEEQLQRWEKSFSLASLQFAEAGVNLELWQS